MGVKNIAFDQANCAAVRDHARDVNGAGLGRLFGGQVADGLGGAEWGLGLCRCDDPARKYEDGEETVLSTHEYLVSLAEDVLDGIVDTYAPPKADVEQWDIEALKVGFGVKR